MGYSPYEGTQIGPDGLRRTFDETPDDIYVLEDDDLELELQLAAASHPANADGTREEITQANINKGQTEAISPFGPESPGQSPEDLLEHDDRLMEPNTIATNDLSELERVRLAELSRRAAPVLAEITPPDGPTHVGAGWYVLDSGVRVRGKTEALAAWKAERETER